MSKSWLHLVVFKMEPTKFVHYKNNAKCSLWQIEDSQRRALLSPGFKSDLSGIKETHNFTAYAKWGALKPHQVESSTVVQSSEGAE